MIKILFSLFLLLTIFGAYLYILINSSLRKLLINKHLYLILILFLPLIYLSLDYIITLISLDFSLFGDNTILLGGENLHMITPGGEFGGDIDSPVDPLPGVKCEKCAENGVETWVLPGKHCPKCSHPC